MDEGLYVLWVITAAADDRFLRAGSVPVGGSGLRIFLITNRFNIAQNSRRGIGIARNIRV